jgi:hypothetical protein
LKSISLVLHTVQTAGSEFLLGAGRAGAGEVGVRGLERDPCRHEPQGIDSERQQVPVLNWHDLLDPPSAQLDQRLANEHRLAK